LRERLVIERRASDQRQELAARFEHAGDDCHRGERVARRLRRRIRSVLREVGAADEANSSSGWLTSIARCRPRWAKASVNRPFAGG
jgi:hypothetical protein